MHVLIAIGGGTPKVLLHVTCEEKISTAGSIEQSGEATNEQTKTSDPTNAVHYNSP